MKLNKSETIHGSVLVSGVLSQASCEFKVCNLSQQGEHFYVYQAEDPRGHHVALKTIHYRSEKKDVFRSAQEYICYRRVQLANEHRLLSISHPALPEPLGMLILENGCMDDNRLFRKVAEWDNLKYQEPVLVEEYLSGYPLTTLADKIKFFSLERRLGMLQKIAKLCEYIHQNGYVLHNLHPSQILLKPRNDDNIHFTGLHNACLQRKTSEAIATPSGPQPVVKTTQELSNENNESDVRHDIFQLGLLLYYLLTLHDPVPTGTWLHKECESDAVAAALHDRQRLEKAIRTLDAKALWLGDLLLQMTAPLELRLPDVTMLLQYLAYPPQEKEKVYFKIVQATAAKTELKIAQMPEWASQLKVRLEVVGKPEVIVKECAPTNVIALPGASIGKLVCSIAATDGTHLSWWEFQNTTVFPDIHLLQREDLPPNRFGFVWNTVAELCHVAFTMIDARGTRADLGNMQNGHAEFPPENVQIPLYENIQIEVQPHFLTPSGVSAGALVVHQLALFPPISAPQLKETADGIELEMAAAKKEVEMYAEIELLHNGWPMESEHKKNRTGAKNQPKIRFFLPWDKMDLFDRHYFNFRVFIQPLGWRAGPTSDYACQPPAVSEVQVLQSQLGWVELSWPLVYHPQLECYEIQCEGEAVARTKATPYRLRLPLKSVVQAATPEITVTVHTVFRKENGEKLGRPAAVKLNTAELKRQFQGSSRYKLTPFFVQFALRLANHESIAASSPSLVFTKENVNEQKTEILGKIPVQPEITLEDHNVEIGDIYHYRLVLEELDLYLLDQRLEIPPITIQSHLKKVGYESCLWEIRIAPTTAACLAGDIEIIREGEESKSHFFKWKDGTETYYFEDKMLLPGKVYQYSLLASLLTQPTPYRIQMGTVTTGKFDLTETVQVFFNRATIVFTPSPAGQVDCVEIYDMKGRQLGTARSDSINLENLEPERKYVFPLKYRYFSGQRLDGPVISFTTLPYLAPVIIQDVEMDSFRIRWDIGDTTLASRIKDYTIEVSGNVGIHKLNPHSRSVQLKNLYPYTTYQWKLCGNFKHGACTLASGETTTQKPNFVSQVEVDLVNYIKWHFQTCPAIEKIEVHRDDVPILQTCENEMYDSDFKGGQEVSYKFYYLLKGGQRVLAGENKLKSLSMSELYTAVKIEPAIGIIKWDFNDLRRFKYLKYIELFSNELSLYKQGGHLALTFEDNGAWAAKENSGLVNAPDSPRNFQLAVIGVAPTVSKCKKKWVLNIKGIKCIYPDVPEIFRYYAEPCCIFFDWERTPTDLLQEIILMRAGDGVVIYRGNNQSYSICDDNQGKGLEPNRKYAYTLEMVYGNYHTTRLLEIELAKNYDPARLEMTYDIENDHLQIKWNKQVKTALSHIGCVMSKWRIGTSRRLSQLFNRPNLTKFSHGALSLPVPSADAVYYQMQFQDRYGHIFTGEMQTIQYSSPEDEEENP
jgi:hypothetical protein